MDYNRAKKLIKTIDIASILQAGIEAAEIIGNEEDLHGKQKSIKATELVKRFLDDFKDEGNITDQEYQDWSTVVETSGDIIFSLVTLASKGNILINTVTKGCKGCCTIN